MSDIYVREGVRIIGDVKLGLADVAAADGVAPPYGSQTVGVASYGADLHHGMVACDRSTTPPRVYNTGGVFRGSSSFAGADLIVPLPLSIFIPKRDECTNAWTAFGPSVTALLFGSVRMEFTTAGAAANIAAASAWALDNGKTLHDIVADDSNALYEQARERMNGGRLLGPTIATEPAPYIPQVM